MQKANGRVEKRGKPKNNKKKSSKQQLHLQSHKKGGFQGHISLGISMAERPNKFKPNGKEIGYV